MRVFSFRAECQDDVDRVLGAMRKDNIYYLLDILRPVILENGSDVPDVDVQLRAKADKLTLISIAESQEDCHVIAETIREVPLSENSLERRRGY